MLTPSEACHHAKLVLTDGTYRIMPKAVPGTDKQLALVSLGDCAPGLAPFDFGSDNSKWNFRQQ